MKLLDRYCPVLVWLSLAVLIFFFWFPGHVCMLSYQEQSQMFLFETDYLVDRITYPGGLARYVAEFVMQFGRSALYGSVAMTVFLMAYQYASLLCVRDKNAGLLTFFLSLVPVVMILACFCDENLSFTMPMAMLFALIAIVAYRHFEKIQWRTLSVIIITPLLYWVAGPVVFVFAIYVSLNEVLVRKQYVLPLFAIGFSVLCLYLSSFVVPYPSQRLWLGINYYKDISSISLLQVLLMIWGVAAPIGAHYIPSFSSRWRPFYCALTELAIALLAIMVLSPLCHDKAKMTVMKTDYLMRNQQWKTIITDAERHEPDNPLTVAALNLALAMTAQQNERAMQFYQNGWEGAFPTYNTTTETSLFLADIYYYVGMVNLTQRFAFEAMEAIPDNNKSCRVFKRLAETNLINGQYEVARRYLGKLKKTLMYRSWAKTTESLLGDEKAINSHPVYGYLRKVRLDNDFLYSDTEIDKMMGQLLMHEPTNIIALQYLLLLPKLEGNQQKYQMYLKFVNSLKK